MGIRIAGLTGQMFTTLQQAVRRAPPGGRILLSPGTYTGSIVLDKAIEIVGGGELTEGSTILQATRGPCLTVSADRVAIRGVSLRAQPGAGGTSSPCVALLKGRTTVEDCNIVGGGTAAVTIAGAQSDPVIRRCHIYGSNSAGVEVAQGGRGTLEGCEIAACKGAGIRILTGGNPKVRACKVRDSGADGCRVESGGRAVLDDCDLHGNGGSGVSVQANGEAALQNCRLADNTADGGRFAPDSRASLDACETADNVGVGLALDATSAVTLKQCRVDTFSGIVSWWPMEGDGTDVKGGNSGATARGATVVKGVSGSALQFSGPRAGISVKDADNLKIAGSLSISVWVLLPANPSGQQQILFRGDDRGSLDPFYLAVGPGPRVGLTIEPEIIGTAAGVDAPIPAGEFVHVTAVFDADAGRIRIYRNGVLASEGSIPYRPFPNLDPKQKPGLGIGNVQVPDAFDQPFQGIIDELQLYDRALTPQEVESLYNRR